MRALLAALAAGAIVAAPVVLVPVVLEGCTPAQRAPARTALEVSQCVNAIALRHIDAGADFSDPKMLVAMAGEIAAECTPRQEVQP